MAGTKSEIEKFDGDGDFSLWKRRMYAFLSVSGLKDVLIEKTKVEEEDSEEDEKDSEKKKKIVEAEIARSERCEKAMNIIFLNVGDHVLRKIERCTTAAETWILLEKLYMPKSLPNRVHTQLRLYSFKMQETRSVDDNIDDFLKIIGDLSNLSIEVPEEVDEVASSARSKEKELKEVIGSRSSSEGHFVRGRSDNRSSQNGYGRKKSFKSRSKSTERKNICWICGKEGHYKKQCYKWLERNKHRNQSERGESSLVKDDAHDLVGLIAAELNITQRTEDNVSQGGAVQERGRVTPEEAEDQENEMVSEDTPSATETDQGYQLARDRTRRTLKPPAKLQDYHSYGVSNKNEVEGGADKEQGGVLKKGVPNQVKSPVQSEVLVKLNRTSTWDSRGTALL
ncbi:hypothetical protein YC2023_005327 [Brassica napus]